ncbi:autotransporter assembly complex protein TamA [Candidatus Venteria ishoeyi]|uniref:Translocation and assembly module subunit TamA n=1 Tax=Candidatus Venteria ishoeyi TaxID=1899563 RepID=A0A1H6FJ07_9GAMM|nr:autotransporter assembly complex family protein [Candidatus Venteria ishoeyi]SEH09004.1 Translocation and assembly module TamA precursor [Candidatus Venteria ishoeyi]
MKITIKYRLFASFLLLCGISAGAVEKMPTQHKTEPKQEAAKVEIRIHGVDKTLEKNIRAHLTLEQQRFHPNMGLSRIKRLLKQANTETRRALAPFGYYQAEIQIQHQKNTLADKPNKAPAWLVDIHIKTGEALKLQKREIKLQGAGEDDPMLLQVVKQFPLKVGDVLLQAQYETGKSSLLNAAQEQGYFDAKLLRHEILIDERAYTASIFLQLHTRQRYRFGEIHFTQRNPDKQKVDILAPELLQRFATFKPGEYYSNQKLQQFRQDLTASDYFSDVVVSINRAESQPASNHAGEKAVPVRVQVQANKPNRYSFALGYGTDTGPRANIAWDRRWVNQHGHYAHAELHYSQLRKSLSLVYSMPKADPRSEHLDLRAGYRNEDSDGRDYILYLLGVSRTRHRHLKTPWQELKLKENLFLDYRRERFKASATRYDTSTMLTPGIEWRYLKADEPLYTRNGYSLSLMLRGASSALLSDTNLLQTVFKGIYIFSPQRKHRLISRLEIGSSFMGNFEKVPASLRFLTGGDKSVRGYDYDSLGPKDDTGTLIGGTHLFVASTEYTYRVYGDWDVAAFYDLGNAFDDSKVALKHSLGFGIHWISPIGPIRLDLAFPLYDKEHRWRIHINMGPDL